MRKGPRRFRRLCHAGIRHLPPAFVHLTNKLCLPPHCYLVSHGSSAPHSQKVGLWPVLEKSGGIGHGRGSKTSSLASLPRTICECARSMVLVPELIGIELPAVNVCNSSGRILVGLRPRIVSPGLGIPSRGFRYASLTLPRSFCCVWEEKSLC